MDIILHLGAHRTASTSFQRYMQAVDLPLSGQGIGFWGPQRTRKGLFHDLPGAPSNAPKGRRAAGRLHLAAHGVARRGAAVLVVSDENMIGTPRANLRAGLLYPEIGERMARYRNAFGGDIRRVVLQIRSLEAYWASVLSYALPRGVRLPQERLLAQLALSARSWRHVIADLACAMPDSDIVVTPFERFAAHPDRLLEHMTGLLFTPRAGAAGFWYNRSPDVAELRRLLEDRGEDSGRLTGSSGRWMPFSPAQAADLRETYADDLFWLRAGAEGLARYIEDPEPDKTGSTWPTGPLRRGHDAHDNEDRAVARHR